MKTILILLITGKAMVGHQLVYSEKHRAEIASDGLYQTLSTDYLDDKERRFASLRSDFSRNKFIPDYEFENSRTQIKERVQKSEDGKKLIIEIADKGKTLKKEMDVVDNAVLSQGFHNFIMAHFDELKDHPLEVNFIVPRKNDFYRFMIQKEKISDEAMELSIRPKNFFLKALVPRISITYHIKLKRLMEFNGTTNIENATGEALKASIGYTYTSSND